MLCWTFMPLKSNVLLSSNRKTALGRGHTRRNKEEECSISSAMIIQPLFKPISSCLSHLAVWLHAVRVTIHRCRLKVRDFSR